MAPTLPNVPGASLDEEELQAEVNGLNGTLDAYRALERSGYSYKAVMEVDFPGFSLLGAEASTTVQGEAKRLIEDGTVYFHNRVKMDTNLPEWGSEDYELFRARIADGSVYDAEDTFGWNNEFTKVAAPVAGDDFYFLPSNLVVSQIAYASSSVKDGVTTHAIVLNDEGASKLIKEAEAATRLDQTLESQPSPYGTWTNLTIESSDFAFEVDAFGLKAIHAALEGTSTRPFREWTTAGKRPGASSSTSRSTMIWPRITRFHRKRRTSNSNSRRPILQRRGSFPVFFIA